MSQFENPFSKLVRREYNVTNLKKILDTFPTSLSVRQLTSNELLERLRELLSQRDIRIEELLAQIENQQGAEDELNQINADINRLRENLDLGDIIAGQLEDTSKDTRVNTLKQRGYSQIGDTDLYVLANRAPFDAEEVFHIAHRDESDGFPESDLRSPDSISFVNVNEEQSIWFKKFERWTSNNNNEPLPQERGLEPTNAWRFLEFKNAHEVAFEIPAGEEITTDVRLNYKSKGEYKDAGLTRISPLENDNTWYGFMEIRAKTGTRDGIDSEEATNIGKMELYRDRK